MSVLEEKLDRLTESLEPFFMFPEDPAETIAPLYQLLRDTGSLIAGGSILEAFHPSDSILNEKNAKNVGIPPTRDIDIYVPVQNAHTFLQRILKTDLFPDGIVVRMISPTLYCQSFLNKNGIKKIITLRVSQQGARHDIDIMIVRRRRTPLQVVNNFDLTFCQAWCDGEKIYASHPEHVRNKSGQLQGEYVPVFLAGNDFLRKRIAKYQRRGYNVEIPAAEPIVLSPHARATLCRPLQEEATAHWARRVLSMWISGYRTANIEKGSIPGWKGDETADEEDANALILPLYSSTSWFHAPSRTRLGLKNVGDTFRPAKEIIPDWLSMDVDEPVSRIEEYDSDDEEDMKRLVQHATEVIPSDFVEADVPAELQFYRQANILLQYAYWPDREIPTLATLIHELVEIQRRQPQNKFIPLRKQNIESYLAALKAVCVRTGEDMISMVEDAVFDFHDHPLEGAISGETLQNYLQGFLEMEVDRMQVPCYYHRGEADACKHPLTFVEIRPAVTPVFYAQFTQKQTVRTDLTSLFEFYDLLLQNEKKPDPKGFGDIFERSVCPYCLEFLSRDEGCIYMTHTPVRGEHSPYCNKDHVVPEQLKRFHAIAKPLLEREVGQWVPDEFVYLQSCIECGRACVNHRHLSLSNGEYQLLPSMGNGVCSGGGRAELFARVLAIRQVFREGSEDQAATRKRAAEFAETCAADPAWIARGQAILEMAEAQREWGNENQSNESNQSSQSNESNQSNLSNLSSQSNESNQSNENENQNQNQNGGRRRYTRKRHQKKLTRMAKRMGLAM